MGQGGANLGSGRPASEEPWLSRTERVAVMVRPGERDDLALIAEAWGVPVATAAWALLSTELGRIRREAVPLGELGAAIVATRRVLAASGEAGGDAAAR
jgi:hypothetical protein